MPEASCCAGSPSMIVVGPTDAAVDVAMINRDEVLDLLDEAIVRLPEELRAARGC